MKFTGILSVFCTKVCRKIMISLKKNKLKHIFYYGIEIIIQRIQWGNSEIPSLVIISDWQLKMEVLA